MRDMVLRGPSQYDCVITYENLAIDYLDEARNRWGELHVDYPEPNIWNEHPYYILDVPWSDSRQRVAAAEFLKFLMSEPIQKTPWSMVLGLAISLCRCDFPRAHCFDTPRMGSGSTCRACASLRNPKCCKIF